MVTVRELRTICQPPHKLKADGWLTANVYRRISIYISWALIHTPITANQVTLSWLVSGTVGAGLIALGSERGVMAGALLIVLSALLDVIDGELARYKGPSLRGAFFEDYNMYWLIRLLWLAVGIRLYTTSESVLLLVIGCLTAAGTNLGASVIRRIVLQSKDQSAVPATEGENASGEKAVNAAKAVVQWLLYPIHQFTVMPLALFFDATVGGNRATLLTLCAVGFLTFVREAGIVAYVLVKPNLNLAHLARFVKT